MSRHLKCIRIDKVHEIFDRIPQINVFSWNALIAQNGFVEKAL